MVKKQTQKSPEDIDVQAATLVGDIRDSVLDLFKNHADWKHIKEAKQQDIVSSATWIAETLVAKTAQIIAGRGFKSMNCTLEQIVVKDGLKMVLKASKMAEGKTELMEHQGGSVCIVLTDINPYLGHRSEPRIDKDQPNLPLDGDE